MPATRSGVAILPRGSGGPAQGSKQYGAPHRLIIIVLTVSCWIFLLAIVLSSIFGASKPSPYAARTNPLKPSALRVTRRHRENAVAHGQEFDADLKGKIQGPMYGPYRTSWRHSKILTTIAPIANTKATTTIVSMTMFLILQYADHNPDLSRVTDNQK
jgi:hypothetical protein